LIPQFELNNPVDALRKQVRFHENWWKDSLPEDLEQNLRSMAGVISQLQPVLGSPEDGGGAVVEVGCGRGTMLRAFIDAGYPAIGCEPSSKLAEIAHTHYGIPPDVLFEMTADVFLNGPVRQLFQPPRAIILWHVLEHLEDPLSLLFRIHDALPDGGHLILQLPLLHQPYVYPEHYFFVNDNSLYYLANKCGFAVVSLEHDLDNFFLTACMRKSAPAVNSASNASTLTDHFGAIAEIILLRDRSIAEKRALLDERWSAMQSMDAMIRERDETIQAQTQLIDDGVAGMNAMERMIRERDETIQAQTRLIDDGIIGMNAMERMIRERDETIQAQTRLIDDGIVGMNAMERMIRERDETIQAQTRLIDDGIVGMNAMERMIRERDEYLSAKERELEILRSKVSGLDYIEGKKIVRLLRAFRIL